MVDLERREYFYFVPKEMMEFEGLAVCAREKSVRSAKDFNGYQRRLSGFASCGG
jgi:hypothetical protein